MKDIKSWGKKCMKLNRYTIRRQSERLLNDYQPLSSTSFGLFLYHPFFEWSYEFVLSDTPKKYVAFEQKKEDFTNNQFNIFLFLNIKKYTLFIISQFQSF